MAGVNFLLPIFQTLCMDPKPLNLRASLLQSLKEGRLYFSCFKACRRLNEVQLHLTLMAPAELCKDAEQLETENMLLLPCFHISAL